MAVNGANVKLQPMNVTWGTTDLGLTDGDISFTPLSEDIVDVVGHQTGTVKLDGIRSGMNVEDISFTLKEFTIEKIQALLGAAGSVAQADGAADEVLGLGTKKQFTNISTQCLKLVLHPVRNAVDDLSEDLAFWKAYPTPGAMTFSGENPATLEVMFKIIPDLAKAAEFQFGVYGDHTDGDFAALEP